MMLNRHATGTIRAGAAADPIGVYDERERARFALKRITRGMSETARRRALGLPPLPAVDPNAIVEPPPPPPAPPPPPVVVATPPPILRPEPMPFSPYQIRVRIGEIVGHIEAVCGLERGDIFGARRHRPIALARRMALVLSMRLPGTSISGIGRVFDMDHSSVMYARAKHNLTVALLRRGQSAKRTKEDNSDPCYDIGAAVLYAQRFQTAAALAFPDAAPQDGNLALPVEGK